MASKASRRRNRRKWRETKQQFEATEVDVEKIVVQAVVQTSVPTSERRGKGTWATGQARKSAYIDLASDMIGRLHCEGKLTDEQLEAARSYEEIWSAYRQDIGVVGFKSCIAGAIYGSGGFDDGDGNPHLKANYDKMVERIGRISKVTLEHEIGKLSHEKPNDLIALMRALNAVAFS